ncbi:unnamed protein product, partial [Rotaria sordida]
MQYNSMNIM